MNEKNLVVFLFCALLFNSCCTGRGLYHQGEGAFKTRSDIAELGKAEGEATSRAGEVEGQIEGGVESAERIEESIKEGEGDIDEFGAIIQRIRKRGAKNSKQSNTGKS